MKNYDSSSYPLSYQKKSTDYYFNLYNLVKIHFFQEVAKCFLEKLYQN